MHSIARYKTSSSLGALRRARVVAGRSIAAVTALPVEPPSAEPDPLDPDRILRALPVAERETFLTGYRQELEAARDPAGWRELRRFLRLWAFRAIAVAQPGYYEARERARVGDDAGGMLLDDAIAAIRTDR
jgi:Family of unknown function (DUF6247)